MVNILPSHDCIFYVLAPPRFPILVLVEDLVSFSYFFCVPLLKVPPTRARSLEPDSTPITQVPHVLCLAICMVTTLASYEHTFYRLAPLPCSSLSFVQSSRTACCLIKRPTHTSGCPVCCLLHRMHIFTLGSYPISVIESTFAVASLSGEPPTLCTGLYPSIYQHIYARLGTRLLWSCGRSLAPYLLHEWNRPDVLSCIIHPPPSVNRRMVCAPSITGLKRCQTRFIMPNGNRNCFPSISQRDPNLVLSEHVGATLLYLCGCFSFKLFCFCLRGKVVLYIKLSGTI